MGLMLQVHLILARKEIRREKTDRFLWQRTEIRNRGLFKSSGRGNPGGSQHIVEEIRGLLGWGG